MKLVIAGYGAEGRSNYGYFRRHYPEADLIVADENPIIDVPHEATVWTGEGVFQRLEDADLVVRTAGLAPSKIVTHGTVWSATNEFFATCPAKIVGVTGTKGKGTTCSLITNILRAAGKTVHLVGNIGVPSLDTLDQIQPDDIVVYELSSFQLWDLERSPHVAVVLMIEPDHLDVHTDMDDYINAKANIVRHQSPGDMVVYCANNTFSRAVAEQSRATKISFPQGISEAVRDSLLLPGQHNMDNLSAAIEAVRCVLPTIDEHAIIKGVSQFSGLPHRLKLVGEVESVRYYDDSIATTPGSAIAAIRSFDDPKILILGGHDKGANYGELAQEIAGSCMRAVVLIGANADLLAAALEAAGVLIPIKNLGTKTTMERIVEVARECARPGDVVILSPAAASFGMFTNYSDRGEQFVAEVEKL